MPTLQLERELELPPYAADVEDHPIALPRQPRHFGRGNAKESRRALVEIGVGAIAVAVVCLAIALMSLGDSTVAVVAQVLLPVGAAVLGAIVGFAHWYRTAP